MIVRFVKPTDIDHYWPQLRPFFLKAMEHAELDTEEGLKERLKEPSTAVGVGFDDKTKAVKVVFSLSKEDYDKGSACEVGYMAGEDMPEWVSAIEEHIMQWAAANGCAYLSMTGRIGWVKHLKALGWSPRATMSKEVTLCHH